MLYKYKKYKQKYINIKNQIGGACEISPEDDETNELIRNQRFKNGLVSIGDKEICYSALDIAELIFSKCFCNNTSTCNDQSFWNKYFPISNISYSESDTELITMDINQIWYIIVNNNNFINELNKMKENYIYADFTEQENLNMKKNIFLYSKEQKEYIEKWLTILKNNKIIITNFDSIKNTLCEKSEIINNFLHADNAIINDLNIILEETQHDLSQVASSEQQVSQSFTLYITSLLSSYYTLLTDNNSDLNITEINKIKELIKGIFYVILEIKKIIITYGDFHFPLHIDDIDNEKIKHIYNKKNTEIYRKSQMLRDSNNKISSTILLSIIDIKQHLIDNVNNTNFLEIKTNIIHLINDINNIIIYNNIYRTSIRIKHLTKLLNLLVLSTGEMSKVIYTIYSTDTIDKFNIFNKSNNSILDRKEKEITDFKKFNVPLQTLLENIKNHPETILLENKQVIIDFIKFIDPLIILLETIKSHQQL